VFNFAVLGALGGRLVREFFERLLRASIGAFIEVTVHDGDLLSGFLSLCISDLLGGWVLGVQIKNVPRWQSYRGIFVDVVFGSAELGLIVFNLRATHWRVIDARRPGE
jgi:hypothetical protein